MTGRDRKGNGRHAEKRSGVDRRIAEDPTYPGPERRSSLRRRSDRAPDKPPKR